MRIGGHLPTHDPLAAADRLGIDVIQIHAPAGSGRDRHANLGGGVMGLAAIADMLAVSGAPAAVLETPGYDDRRAQDVEILRYLLATTGC